MGIIDQLASSLGRRDEIPNQELARQIVKDSNHAAVAELVSHLNDKDKAIPGDCIKVIYEIAVLSPNMASGHYRELANLLDHKNNRLQWGAMTALNAVALEIPDVIFENLPKFLAVAEKGSVITKDHLMGILIKLCTVEKYAEDAFSLFNEQLAKAPANQLPMYAEQAIPIINNSNKVRFLATLTARLDDIEKETKKARVQKVIKKIAR